MSAFDEYLKAHDNLVVRQQEIIECQEKIIELLKIENEFLRHDIAKLKGETD